MLEFLRQLAATLRPYGSEAPGAPVFAPERLHHLLESWVDAALRAETAQDWLEA